jgi:hypothetical protein
MCIAVRVMECASCGHGIRMKGALMRIATRVIGCGVVRSSRSNEGRTCAHRSARDRVQLRAVIEVE